MDVLLGTGPLPPLATPCAEHSEHLVRRVDASADELLGVAEVAQITDADAAPAVLVLVGRANTPPRRADLLPFLAGAIQQLVIRQRQVSAIGNVQLVLGANAPLLQGVELCKQLLGIEHHAIADHADRALEDSRGYLVQDKRLALARVDRVPGV